MGKISGLVKSSKAPRVLSTPPEMSVIDTNNKIYRINSMSKGISNHPYFSDPLVVPRVKQYLEENRSNLFVNLDDIVEVLQKKYREYGRKKRSAFKSVVKKALEVVIHSYGIAERSPSYDVSEDSDDDDDDDDDDIDIDVEDENDIMDESSNNVNNHLVSIYMQNQKQGSGPGQELINISSDEDTNNDSPNHKPPILKTGVATITRTPKVENTLTPTKTILIKSGTDNESTNHLKRKALPFSTPNKRRRTVPVTIPAITFKDIGGCEKVIKEVSQLLLHIRHPEVYKTLGVSAPRGFLLHGPPGSGKTLVAHAIAGELGISLVKVAGPEMVGSQSGESEERIRDLFDQALALAPSVLFIDEVDAITPHRETAQREMERRIVAQLLSSLDELGNQENGEQVLVIGATNRPDALDPALRRAGRFDREVCLGIPDSSAREGILKTLCKELKLAVDVSLDSVAMMTPGFVGADLKALVTEAAMAAVNRLFSEIKTVPEEKEIKDCNSKVVSSIKVEEGKESKSEVCTDDVTLVSTTEENIEIEVIEDEAKVEVNVDNSDEVVEVSESPRTVSLLKEPPLTPSQLANLFITMKDFEIAMKTVQPSAKREGFATVPDVTWDDIGSLQDIRQELQMAIMAPVRYPKQFEALGLNKPTGVLLCGPPGCGKTLLAKAVANEAGINFISVKGPELLNMYVGESERAVRQCFQRARNSQPCVIFFDELDALCPKRSNLNETGASRVVNQLLTEMDGVEGRVGVFLMAATNRPDIVDPAVMRPGRLDKVLYVGLPAQSDRVDILRALTKNGTKPVLSEDVKMEDIANDSQCQGYTGADLAALIREAGVQALKEFMADPDNNSLVVAARHFTSAFEKIRPSVSPKDQLRYEQLRVQYAAVPSTK